MRVGNLQLSETLICIITRVIDVEFGIPDYDYGSSLIIMLLLVPGYNVQNGRCILELVSDSARPALF